MPELPICLSKFYPFFTLGPSVMIGIRWEAKGKMTLELICLYLPKSPPL
jgi:hypothetical protein